MKKYLFCYGSNNPEQLVERLGRSVTTHEAYLEDHQRVFRGFSNKWNGGVATVIKKSGRTCYGLVCEVKDADIAIIDKYEGYPFSYIRKELNVIADGKKIKAIVYIANSKEWNAPSDSYLKAIHKTVSTFWSVKSFKDFYNDD